MTYYSVQQIYSTIDRAGVHTTISVGVGERVCIYVFKYNVHTMMSCGALNKCCLSVSISLSIGLNQYSLTHLLSSVVE